MQYHCKWYLSDVNLHLVGWVFIVIVISLWFYVVLVIGKPKLTIFLCGTVDDFYNWKNYKLNVVLNPRTVDCRHFTFLKLPARSKFISYQKDFELNDVCTQSVYIYIIPLSRVWYDIYRLESINFQIQNASLAENFNFSNLTVDSG